MRALIWGAIAAAAGLAWITIESVIGLHDSATSYGPTILWLIIPPVCAIGAMTQERLSAQTITYGQVVKTGLVTSAMSGVILCLVWVLFTQLLDPDYLNMMVRSIAMKSTAMGEHEGVTAERIRMARMIFDGATFYVIGLLMPMITGTIASFIGGLGLQKVNG